MRSKVLLAANLLSLLYSGYLLWYFGSPIVKYGVADFIEGMKLTYKVLFDMLNIESSTFVVLNIILILLCIHIVAFVLGCLNGWLAFVSKKSGFSKFAAVLYLLGTFCFPIYFIFGLPITIMGFIGAAKQKRMSDLSTAS